MCDTERFVYLCPLRSVSSASSEPLQPVTHITHCYHDNAHINSSKINNPIYDLISVRTLDWSALL